jgi:hypothetical protein
MESREYRNEAFDLRLDMEIVAWATWLGLAFPLIFLWCNKDNVPQANTLIVLFVVLVTLVILPYMLVTGQIFPRILEILIKRPGWIRKGLYVWGWFLLILVAFLVYCTGGIQSSIFGWLFEYALIVTLIVGPVSSRSEKTLFEQWRPVLLTGGFEIIIIVVLVLSGGGSKSIPETMNNSMPIWGGLSVFSSLIVSALLFWFSIKKSERGN